MTQLIGTRNQQVADRLFDASGTITAGGTSQLILPERKSTTHLFIQNISDTDMYFQIGTAYAKAVLTGGVVTSCTILNGGFGFTIAPEIEFLGGGAADGWNMNNPTFLGCGQPGYQSPANPAKGRCVLTGGVITSIIIDFGGANYAQPPYVWIKNSPNDPFGAANPNYASTPNGFYAPGSSAYSIYYNGTACPTDPLSVYCATTGKAFSVKWLP